VVQEPVEEQGGNHGVAEDLAPLGEAPVQVRLPLISTRGRVQIGNGSTARAA
jgi:hypothetical protein